MMYLIDGGPLMYVVVALDVVGLGVIGVSLVISIGARFFRPMLWPARIFAVVVLLGALTPTLAGAVGWAQGVTRTEQALRHAPADTREAIRQMGYMQSRYPLVFGLSSTAILGFLALFPLGIAAIPAKGGQQA